MEKTLILGGSGSLGKEINKKKVVDD